MTEVIPGSASTVRESQNLKKSFNLFITVSLLCSFGLFPVDDGTDDDDDD